MFRKFVTTILLSVPVGVTILDCVGYVARVDGFSMQPVLNPNSDQADYVFLSRWFVRSDEIKRGDIVSLISPKDPTQKLIKRIVGLEGDIVATMGYKHEQIKIPPGHCWVEGDHRSHSLDSNTFGPIPLGLTTGRATYIVWPPERMGKLERKLPGQRKQDYINQ